MGRAASGGADERASPSSWRSTACPPQPGAGLHDHVAHVAHGNRGRRLEGWAGAGSAVGHAPPAALNQASEVADHGSIKRMSETVTGGRATRLTSPAAAAVAHARCRAGAAARTCQRQWHGDFFSCAVETAAMSSMWAPRRDPASSCCPATPDWCSVATGRRRPLLRSSAAALRRRRPSAQGRSPWR